MNIRQLRHKIDEVVTEQLPDGSASGGSGTTDTPSDSTNTVVVPIEQLEDEEGAFFPKTHVKAVITADNRRLNTVLDEMASRLAEVENTIPGGSTPRIADNFLTDSKTVSLSASRGKYLYDGIDQSADVKWNADKVVLRDAVVKASHIAEGAVESTHIAAEAVGEEHLQDDCVTTQKVAQNAITKDKLSSEVQTTVERIETFGTWQAQVDDTLEDYEERITALEQTSALIKEQNTYLLTLHQKMKHSVLTLKYYNATTATWDEIPVADYSPQQTLDSATPVAAVSQDIVLESIRMTGLKLDTKWRFYDEMDAKDYLPESYSLKAVITPEEGDTRTVQMSTDRGMNNVSQELSLLDLHLGDTVVITSTCHYCWLDFPISITLNITE